MEVDRQLLFAARRLITGANVHRINTLIFQYETAVKISKDDKARGLDLQAKEFERRLRILVRELGESYARRRYPQHCPRSQEGSP
jgi:hypothetical protein